MRETFLRLCASVFLLFLAFSAQGGTIGLGINPITQQVIGGSPVYVGVLISGLGNGTAPSLGAFDLDVGYDESILEYHSATFGDPFLGDQLDLLGFGSISGDTSVSGSVNLFEVSFDPVATLNSDQAPGFNLVTLLFRAAQSGTRPIGLSNVVLSDADGNALSADIRGGSVSVVPLPGAVWLFGSAMTAFAGFLGFRHKQTSTV